MKKVLTEQRLCELSGLQKEVERKSYRDPKTKKYTPLKPGVDIGPTGTIDLEMDPADVVGGATTVAAPPVEKPPIPDEVPWGRSGPSPTAYPEVEPDTDIHLRHRPAAGSAWDRWRSPSPEAEPVEGEPGLFWHKSKKGKWIKLPIGVKEPAYAAASRAARLPAGTRVGAPLPGYTPAPPSIADEYDPGPGWSQAAIEKRRKRPAQSRVQQTDFPEDRADLALGGVTPEEARAILARQRQKKD